MSENDMDITNITNTIDGEANGQVAMATSAIVVEYIKAAGPMALSKLEVSDVLSLTESVRNMLLGVEEKKVAVEPVPEEKKPLVYVMPIKKTIRDDCLISLEDGKPYKALKRHLRKLGMTPDQYRSKWKLPHDYPMVCKAYSERRSDLAKEMGLGKK